MKNLIGRRGFLAGAVAASTATISALKKVEADAPTSLYDNLTPNRYIEEMKSLGVNLVLGVCLDSEGNEHRMGVIENCGEDYDCRGPSEKKRRLELAYAVPKDEDFDRGLRERLYELGLTEDVTPPTIFIKLAVKRRSQPSLHV